MPRSSASPPRRSSTAPSPWACPAPAADDVVWGQLVVEVGNFAKATVVLDHSGLARYAGGVAVLVGDGADVTLVSVQDWAPGAVHGGQYDAVVGRDATFKQVVVTLGGDVVRLVSNVHYSGTGASAELFGVYFADETQHQEHRLWVDHSVPNCTSNVLYKGALQGEDARTVWIGDVRIRPAATGTNTYELNRNLVLTDGARADSVPNLEIETGEIVGAGHASATGRFDDEQLFYLCSRGIDAETARRLVVRGFFADVVQHIGLPELQDRLMGTIEARLGALPGPGGAGGRRMSFERVCALKDVEEPGSLRVELDDVDIAVVRFEGEVYAIEDLCSHAEVPLSEGDVEEFKGAPTIECWLHGSCFDLRTGEPTNLPATEPVSVYPVRVEGEDVYVDVSIDDSLPAAASN